MKYLVALMVDLCYPNCMSTHRVLDTDKLRTWIASQESGIARLSLKSGLSVSLINKLLAGSYGANISERSRLKICKAVGMSEDALFPNSTDASTLED